MCIAFDNIIHLLCSLMRKNLRYIPAITVYNYHIFKLMATAQRHLKKSIFIFHSDPIHVPIDLFCRCGRKWKDKLKFLFPIWLRLAEFFLLFRQLNVLLVGKGVRKYWQSDFPFNFLNVPFWYKSKATSVMYLENTIPSFVNIYLFLMLKSWFFNFLFLLIYYSWAKSSFPYYSLSCSVAFHLFARQLNFYGVLYLQKVELIELIKFSNLNIYYDK